MRLLLIARHAAEPTQNRIDNGLIQGDPKMAVFAEGPCHLFREACEEGDDGGVFPTPAMGEPKWGGEVMERDHRFEIVIAHALENGAIAVDGGIVPESFAGFDAAPLHRHAVGILAHRLCRF